MQPGFFEGGGRVHHAGMMASYPSTSGLTAFGEWGPGRGGWAWGWTDACSQAVAARRLMRRLQLPYSRNPISEAVNSLLHRAGMMASYPSTLGLAAFGE
mgnify:CR=1 FL=1